MCTMSCMPDKQTTDLIWIKFCKVVGITDIIISASFDDERLLGCGMVEVNFGLPN